MVDAPATGDVLITTEGRRHLLSVVPYPHRLMRGDYDLALDIARRWAKTNAVEVRLRERRQRHQGAAGLGRCLLHAQGGCSTWEHGVATRAPVIIQREPACCGSRFWGSAVLGARWRLDYPARLLKKDRGIVQRAPRTPEPQNLEPLR